MSAAVVVQRCEALLAVLLWAAALPLLIGLGVVHPAVLPLVLVVVTGLVAHSCTSRLQPVTPSQVSKRTAVCAPPLVVQPVELKIGYDAANMSARSPGRGEAVIYAELSRGNPKAAGADQGPGAEAWKSFALVAALMTSFGCVACFLLGGAAAFRDSRAVGVSPCSVRDLARFPEFSCSDGYIDVARQVSAETRDCTLFGCSTQTYSVAAIYLRRNTDNNEDDREGEDTDDGDAPVGWSVTFGRQYKSETSCTAGGICGFPIPLDSPRCDLLVCTGIRDLARWKDLRDRLHDMLVDEGVPEFDANSLASVRLLNSDHALSLLVLGIALWLLTLIVLIGVLVELCRSPHERVYGDYDPLNTSSGTIEGGTTPRLTEVASSGT